MKNIAIALFFAMLSMLAGAQTGVLTVTPSARQGTIDEQRAKISTERTRLEAVFLAEDAACYKRFFVNSCLGEVNSRRREAMADLRRQEISLNDEERRSRGAEQIRKTEEKSSPEKQQEAADRRAKALEDYQSRLDREQKKGAERATAQSSERAASQASAERLRANQEKAQARTDKQATAAEESKKFDARQQEAQERRARYESDRLKRVKPPAKPLPLPE
jgi:colicin import membrane protein